MLKIRQLDFDTIAMKISLLPLLVVVGAQRDGSDVRPTVDANGVSCSSPPPILSYHVHGAWNARNVTQSRVARTTFDAFAKALDSRGLCPHSHANAAPSYEHICAFPFDWGVVEKATNESSGLFGDMNHAYFMPPALYVSAMNWWRQHHGDLHYMMHANTGCEYEDHSAWSMVSNNYPKYKQSLEGLWCCKRGPPSCTCDMVTYSLAASPDACLSYTEPTAIGLGPCRDTPKTWGSVATWRETNYTSTFRQVEVYATPSGGDSADGAGLCLSPETCTAGAPVRALPCRDGDASRTRASWRGGTRTTVRERGALASDSCPGYCVVPGDNATVVLGACDEDVWTRLYLD